MKKDKVFIAGFFLVLILFIPVYTYNTPIAQYSLGQAVSGKLDLREVNFSNLVISLKGEWEFYWNELLFPEDFTEDLPEPPVFWKVPAIWNSYLDQGDPVGGEGFATYRLFVQIPEGIHSLGIKMPNQATSYRMFVNNKEIVHNGVVGRSREEAIPRDRLNGYYFTVEDSTLEIIIQVSNFSHFKGGLWGEPVLGLVENISNNLQGNAVREGLIAGGLMIFGLYFIGLFFIQRNSKTNLYFALFCLGVALRSLVKGDLYLFAGFEWLPWEFYTKANYLMVPSTAAAIAYLRSIFPTYFHKWVYRILEGVSFSYILFILVMPARIYSTLAIPYYIFIFFTVLYLFYVLFKEIHSKNKESWFVLLGFCGFLPSGIAEILHAMHINYFMGDTTTLGVLVLIISQAFLLSRRLFQSFIEVERLSGILKDKNQELIRLSRLKNDFLLTATQELEQPFSFIMKNLNTLLQHPRETERKEAPGRINQVISQIDQVRECVYEIADLSRLHYSGGGLNRQEVVLDTFLISLIEELSTSRKYQAVQWKNHLPQNLPSVWIDEKRLFLALINLLKGMLSSPGVLSMVLGGQVRRESVIISLNLRMSLHGEFEKSDQHSNDLISSKEDQKDSLSGYKIAQEMVKLHGGTFSRQTLREGEYLFAMQLPRGEQLGIEEAMILPYIPEFAGYRNKENKQKYHILIAEEDPLCLLLLKEHLLAESNQIYSVTNGVDARRILAKEPIDMAILNISLPKVSGIELCLHIREDYSLLELPVFLLSEEENERALETAYQAGANDYLLKPFLKDQCIHRVNTWLDMLDLTRNNRKLITSVNIKKTLLQTISHDFRNSVAVIMDVINQLRDKTSAEEQDQLEAMSSSAQRIMNLFDNLIDDARIGNHKLKLLLHDYDLNALIISSLELKQSLAHKKQQKLTFVPLEGNYPEIKIDRNRMLQVLCNLLDNAIKYSPYGGSIEIKALFLPGRLFRVEVSDSGPGISEKEQGHLFERFGSLSAEPTGGESSIGLGLYICKEIIQLHKGKIGMVNTLSGGSLFFFEIPEEVKTGLLSLFRGSSNFVKKR